MGMGIRGWRLQCTLVRVQGHKVEEHRFFEWWSRKESRPRADQSSSEDQECFSGGTAGGTSFL